MQRRLVGHGAGQERDAVSLSRDGRASEPGRPFLPQFALDPYLILHEALCYGEAIADRLNPLTMSHIARTISCGAMGRVMSRWTVDRGAI